MNTDLGGAVNLAQAVVDQVEQIEELGDVRIAVCTPFVSLQAVGEVIHNTPVRLGAQNMHFEDSGAYTGEVSAAMLTSVGCTYVILGHSERRQYFGETDDLINKKVRQARNHGLIPIICVGETLDQREAGEEEAVVRRQVEGVLDGVDVSDADTIVLAYEPVWAIGTGRTATPDQAQAMHAFIRGLLRERYSDATASRIHLLYGGSMKPANAEELLAQPDVDGGLIGGASLKAADFAAIVEAGKA